MADPVPNPIPAPSSQYMLNFWGSSIVSVYILTIFLVALVIAFWVKNEVLIVALVSVAATNVTTVVAYWVGSSSGSAKKDSIIASHTTTINQKTPIRTP
jgi:hypothetical protein